MLVPEPVLKIWDDSFVFEGGFDPDEDDVFEDFGQHRKQADGSV